MHSLDGLMASHPKSARDRDAIADAISACFECAAACALCADACLSESNRAMFDTCIRLDIDCATICSTTGLLAAQVARPGPQPLQAQLAACIAACQACAEECGHHAPRHGHCLLCAEACRECEDACAELLRSLHRAENRDQQPTLWARGTV